MPQQDVTLILLDLLRALHTSKTWISLIPDGCDRLSTSTLCHAQSTLHSLHLLCDMNSTLQAIETSTSLRTGDRYLLQVIYPLLRKRIKFMQAQFVDILIESVRDEHGWARTALWIRSMSAEDLNLIHHGLHSEQVIEWVREETVACAVRKLQF